MSVERTLTRRAASEAVGEQGWRFLLGSLRTAVPVTSLAEAADVVARAVAVCGDDADGHLIAEIRRDRVLLGLRSPGGVTSLDVDLAHRISAIASTTPRVQLVEIGIDALDIAAVRPFWEAVLGGHERSSPPVWFQQMDEPRPQRNRIHFDVCVPHDEAPRRIEAALAAGGRLVSDQWAPAFWVLADPEGNEACITTWQGRDPEVAPSGQELT